MITEEWLHLFSHSARCCGPVCQCIPNRSLAQELMDCARAMTQEPAGQEDLYQEAWLAIGTAPGDLRAAEYRRLGVAAMARGAHQERRFHEKQGKARTEMAARLRTGDSAYGMPSRGAQKWIRYKLKKKAVERSTA